MTAREKVSVHPVELAAETALARARAEVLIERSVELRQRSVEECYQLDTLRQTISGGVAEATEVELRCPTGAERNGYCHPGKLLAKLKLAGERPSFVQPDNLIEMPCEECSTRQRRGDPGVKYVLHRYDLAGNCVSTLAVRR